MTGDTDQLRELAGEPFHPDTLIQIQEGAVVSRTLVDRESATLTVFAFDQGQRLSEHTAPHDALLQVIDGTAEVTIDGESMTVNEEEAVVLPADVPHAVTAATAFKMILTMIR